MESNDTVSGRQQYDRAGRSRYAQWAIAFFLGVIAACLLLRGDSPLGSLALAQSTSAAGARGVFAFTGPLDKERSGVFMVDVDQGTIWCYEITDRKGSKNLNLVAGRSWRFDRYLEKFNDGDLSMDDVEAMVERQRSARLRSAAAVPAASPTPGANQPGAQGATGDPNENP